MWHSSSGTLALRKVGLSGSATLIALLAIGASLATASDDMYRASIDSPPRLQWEPNYGYCGEVSVISAGLRYGQYVGQYEAREIASNGTNQSKEGSQLLLGVNAEWAATQMHLDAEEWDNSGKPNAPDFLAWVKKGIMANSSVIIGVYTNEYLFYDDKNPNAGDNAYDHIVPVMNVASESPLTPPATYHANDTITFSDNGLYTPDGKPTYIYHYNDGSFQKTRQQANSKNSPPYSLPSGVKNYGLVISGIIDNDGRTLPVQLATNINYEKPSIKEGSNKRPAPEKLTLTVTIESLQAGQYYNLYRYDNFTSVPNSSFNAKHAQADKSWRIHATGTSYSLSETIMSDEIAVYRAVPESAP